MKKYLILAIVCMAVSFFAFMTLVSEADLSFAVPASAASFVFETILARYVLRERVDAKRWLGAAWWPAAWLCWLCDPSHLGDCRRDRGGVPGVRHRGLPSLSRSGSTPAGFGSVARAAPQAVSILKPVRGLDAGFREAIASHTRLHGEYELLCGVRSWTTPPWRCSASFLKFA